MHLKTLVDIYKISHTPDELIYIYLIYSGLRNYKDTKTLFDVLSCHQLVV